VKKEVIYFSAFSMMEPEQVELLENNKAIVRSSTLVDKILDNRKDEFVDIPDYKILSFWDKIDEIGAWKWSKKYPVKEPELIQITDGYSWTLKLRNRNGKAKYCSGYMSFPRKFKDLIKELNNLFGSNIRI
jgi:hypothetical protein